MDEDESWLESLAGRTVTGDEHAVREAKLLREQIHAHRMPAAATVAPIDAKREEALIARARAEGVLPQTPARARRLPSWLLAAAALAGVALLVGVWRTASPPDVVVRGVASGVVRLESSQPKKLHQRLLQELTAAGARAKPYERFGRLGIDAELPQPVTPALRELLERRHIAVPPDGALVIEITSPDMP